MIRELKNISKTVSFCNEMIEDFMQNAWDYENLTKMVALSLYRDAIEGMDSLYILADHGSQNAAGVSYRHMFEIVVSLMYMIGDESKMEQRAQCYYISEQKHKITEMQKVLNSSSLTVNEKNDLREKLRIVRDSLKQPAYEDTLKEWEDTKKLKRYKKFDPKWHSLFEGPSSIVGLIDYLSKNDELLKNAFAIGGFQAFFENAYSIFSRTAHSYSSLENYLPLNTEKSNLIAVNLRPLRITTEEVLKGPFRIADSVGIILIVTVVFILRFYPEYKEKFIAFAGDLA
ncbi:DUF5677 domain-containing protein [Bacillus thuringiensis]|uniref:DUF5677 domain-containing protein n=1 Tax=Bacillus thuringiensis TaxID=1428 RepID=UPI00301613BA